MKRVWIVCAFVVVILLLGAASIWHLSVMTGELDGMLVQLSEAVDRKDSTLVQKAVDFEERWETLEAMMMRYIHHDELDAITGTVARLKALARYQDYAEMSAEIDRLRHLVRHIYESEIPSFGSVF